MGGWAEEEFHALLCAHARIKAMLNCSFSAVGMSQLMCFTSGSSGINFFSVPPPTCLHSVLLSKCFGYAPLIFFVKHWQWLWQPIKSSRRCRYLLLPGSTMWSTGCALGSALMFLTKVDVTSAAGSFWSTELQSTPSALKEPVLLLGLHGGGLEHLPKDFEDCFCKKAAKSSWRT